MKNLESLCCPCSVIPVQILLFLSFIFFFILEKTFGFFLNFFEDFNSPSLKKGIIVGSVIGIVGTIIVGALIYFVVR